MLRNGRLQIVFAGVVMGCSSSLLWAQQLPSTPPTSAVAAEAADAVGVVVSVPARHLNPPHVKCAVDEMTIEADNSLLSSVLDAVHSCIGAKIELPEGAVDSPVFFQFGPGRTRDVLNSLLSETDLDFVILLSPSTPERVLTVELLARSTDLRDPKTQVVATNGPMTPARLAWLATRELGRGVPAAEESAIEPFSKDIGLSPQPGPRRAATASDATAEANAVVVDAGASTSTAAVTPEIPVPDAPKDSSAASPTDQELQHKITDMQQLFEQRKKMNAAPQ